MIDTLADAIEAHVDLDVLLAGTGVVRHARSVFVIGIGSGQPEHLTGEAVAALNSVDVFLVADKGGRSRTWSRCAPRCARR